jgi:hypothetical protein
MRRQLKRLASLTLTFVFLLALLPSGVLAAGISQSFRDSCSTSYKNGRYYSLLCEVNLTGNLGQDVVAVAESQIGYHEGNSGELSGGNGESNVSYTGNYSEYYNYVFGNNGSGNWCQAFVTWCFRAAGIGADKEPKNPFYMGEWAKVGASIYSWKDYEANLVKPKAGDVIVYHTSSSADINGSDISGTINTHIGIITSESNGVFYTIEGNTSNSGGYSGYVSNKKRTSTAGTGYVYTTNNKKHYIYAIIRPNYGGSIVDGVHLTGANYPTILTKGQSFSIKGTVVSDETNIGQVKISIAPNGVVYNDDGTVFSEKSWVVHPNTKTYDIHNLDSQIKFGVLPVGSFNYIISAYNDCSNAVLLNKTFTITSQNPSAPAAPSVRTSGSTVYVSWGDVANETGYDVYLVQPPWRWEDIEYSTSLTANTTSTTFYNVADGDYAAFVIARPNADTVQSAWTAFTIRTNSYLNVDAYVDGVLSDGFSGIGLIDVYVNGGQVAAGWGDYWALHPVGASYEIRNIRPEYGYSYDGIAEGSRVGTITDAERTTVVLNFRTVSNNAPTATASGSLHGNTYYFVNREVTWFEAKKLCENMGGHLATIGSAEENAYVFGIAQNTQAWLGATDRANEGEWCWITGEPFNYTNWAGNQPDNCGGEQEEGESYLHFSWESGGRWNDNAGCALLPFVCEIDGEPVSITSQPKDAAVAVGNTATFAVAATGATSYQWYYRTSSSGSWTAVAASSGKTATYSLTVEALHNGYQYRCLVSNATDSVYTNTVTLTVRSEATITTQPKNYVGAVGSTATATVKATGDGLSYQWYFANPGATGFTKSGSKTATYSATLTEANSGRRMYCVIKDAYGNSVTTNTVTMTVAANPVSITTQPKNYVGAVGSTATATVKATGEGLSYQWYFANPDAAGFTKSGSKTATYSATLTAANSGRRMYCVITDADGNTVKTNTITMTIG